MYFVSLHYSSSLNYKHGGAQSEHAICYMSACCFLSIQHTVWRPRSVKTKVLASKLKCQLSLTEFSLNTALVKTTNTVTKVYFPHLNWR